jgi:uncharacterized protein (DUF2141 family)
MTTRLVFLLEKVTMVVILLGAVTALAQNTLSGTLYADNVQGLVVVACYTTSPEATSCDESRSAYAQITSSGPSASYQFANLSAGQYLVFVWRDKNGSGTVEENGDDFFYYADANGHAMLVQPPASGIDVHLTATQNPLAQTPANPLSSPAAPSASPGHLAEHQLIGKWYYGLGNGQYIWFQFTDMGAYTYSSPVVSSSGTFKIENDQLTLTPPVNGAASYTIQLECIGRGSFSEYLTLRSNATHLETPYVRDPTDPRQFCK